MKTTDNEMGISDTLDLIGEAKLEIYDGCCTQSLDRDSAIQITQHLVKLFDMNISEALGIPSKEQQG